MAQDISKMETTQTAVDWLIQELELERYPYIIKQAKQMEKEQIKEGYIMSLLDSGNKIRRDAEDYYNETYGGKDL